MNTREWPPFFSGTFAYVFGQGVAVVAAGLVLGAWPDDPLLLLPYMSVAYGVAGGAFASALAFAPAVSWSRRVRAVRPWFEMLVLTISAAVGAVSLMTILLGSFLLGYVPGMIVIAIVLSAIGAAMTILAYWLLAGRPK